MDTKAPPIGSAAKPGYITPRDRDTWAFKPSKQAYIISDESYHRIGQGHGLLNATLWARVVFGTRVQQPRTAAGPRLFGFGFCCARAEGLALHTFTPARTVKRALAELAKAGVIHRWARPGRQTVYALGITPTSVYDKRGGSVLTGPSRRIPKEAYAFEFGQKDGRPNMGRVVMLSAECGNWWAVDEVGNETQLPDEAPELDLEIARVGGARKCS